MHIGFGEFYNTHLQDKLYKTYAQRSSIRTTSSEFLYYRTGVPILLSDFVTFNCSILGRRCRKGCTYTSSTYLHISRVIGVGRDFRTAIRALGQAVLQVQEVFYPRDLRDLPGVRFDPPLLEYEIILSQNNMFFCNKSQIRRRFNIRLDYTFSNNKIRADRPVQVQVFDKSLILRRIVDIANSIEAVVTLLCLNYPICSELEIQTFGRAYIESLDPRQSRRRRTMSLPLLTFIDAFGLYRNLYRLLIGIYFILASLYTRERDRRANVFPLTLGPYSSNFADVVEAIKLLATLNQGIEVYIPGRGNVLLVAFTIAFLSDMPQQQKNSRIKTQRANLSCRIYYIYANFRGILDYNVFLEGRYYYTVIDMRRDIDSLPTKAARDAYRVEQGIDPDPAAIALTTILLALDIIQTRPSNPAYSEYQGLTSIMHHLLLDGILSPKAGD